VKLTCLALAIASVLFAQRIPNPNFIPGPSNELRTYLDLTNDQVTRLNALNLRLLQFQAEKSQRMAVVARDAQLELQKSPLDPMAVGLRYVELEVIRREIYAERRKVLEEVQGLLTAPQKTKLQSLVEILRAYPLACEAIGQNLLTPPSVAVLTPAPVLPNIGQGGIASFLLGTLPCGGGIPSIRTGDFTTTSPAPMPVAP